MSLTLLVFFYHFFFFLPFAPYTFSFLSFSLSLFPSTENGNGENIAGDKSGDDTEESESDESDEGK